MLVLAVDTSTPVVGAALVTGAGDVLAASGESDARRHGELLAPAISRLLADADVPRSALTDVAVGVGPGPFTGLRVGMATAMALGDALGLPVRGLCSLDSLADAADDVVVVTDARRREVYWARYARGHRVEGPAVERPAALAERLLAASYRGVVAGPGADLYAGELEGLVHRSGATVSAAALGRRLVGGAETLPLVPLYLRRPDVADPRPPKPVTPSRVGA